jgi:ribosome biogenesis GTPase A
MILVLNKIDLVPPTVAAAWKNYFQTKFPRFVKVFHYSGSGTRTDPLALPNTFPVPNLYFFYILFEKRLYR